MKNYLCYKYFSILGASVSKYLSKIEDLRKSKLQYESSNLFLCLNVSSKLFHQLIAKLIALIIGMR